MAKVKSFITSPWMLIVLMCIKLFTYYSLINVNLLGSLVTLGSILILLLIFFEFGTSKFKYKNVVFFILYVGFSVLMFADSMYFNYYNQTVSVKQLWQASNVAKVPNSFIATLIPASFILLFEVPATFYLFCKYAKEWAEQLHITRRVVNRCRWVLILALVVASINPMDAKLIRKFNSIEFFSNHLNDAYYSVVNNLGNKSVTKKEVLDEVDEVKETPKADIYQGICKGKNLIVIQMESLQNFVVGATYNGQELTPNINELLRNDTIYFNNFYSNIGKGNTVDAEFTTLNSLYPVIDRECYSLYTTNTYNGLPWLMRNQGYTAMAIHGYEGSFWNRENAYPYQGFQQFYSQEDLISDEIIGLGISDKSMFRQTIDILKKQENPFFSFIITLTNHHPYILPAEMEMIDLLDQDKGTAFGSYLETVAYTDAAIGQFIQQLKAEGLYDNTVIAMYGDHHGLNCNMDENYKTVSNFIGKSYDYDEMFKVPLIIHVPNSGVTDTISTTGGQIDFLPTIANLFDIKIPQPYVLGRDLVNSDSGFVAFTVYLFEGSFIKDNIMFEISREKLFDGSRAWNINSGVKQDIELFRNDYERALKVKQTSTYILDNDLMASMYSHNRDIVIESSDETSKPMSPEDELN